VPQLADPQHEAFAVHVSSGNCSYTEAAKLAGYASANAHNTGSRLAKRSEIAARISELVDLSPTKELSESQKAKHPIEKFTSKHWVVHKTVTLQQLARTDKQYAVALNCLRLLAQLGQLDENKGQSSPKSLTQINLQTMTPKQASDALREMMGEIPPAERAKIAAMIPELMSTADAQVVDSTE
jgi:hypothetical protein